MSKSATKYTHCLAHPRPAAGFFAKNTHCFGKKVSPMGGNDGTEVRRRTGKDNPAKEPAEGAGFGIAGGIDN